MAAAPSQRFLRPTRVLLIGLCSFLPVLYSQDSDDLNTTIRAVQENIRQLQAQIKQLDKTLKDLAARAKQKPPKAAADEKHPDIQQAQRFYNEGLQSETDGLYDFAIQAFTIALKNDPDSDASYQHRGYCHYRLGHTDAAISDLTRSLLIQPNNSRAYELRAKVFAESGQSTLALGDLYQAIWRNPSNPETLLLRARIERELGNFTQSINDCQRVLEMDRNSAEGHLCNAELLSQLGSLDRAADEVQEAIRLKPDLGRAPALFLEIQKKMNAQAAARNPAPSVTASPAPPATAPPVAAPPPPPPPAAQSVVVGQGIPLSTVPQAAPVKSEEKSSAGPTPPPPVTPPAIVDGAVRTGSPAPSRSATAQPAERSVPAISSPPDQSSAGHSAVVEFKKAREFEEQGRQLAADGRLKESLYALNQAIQLNPRSSKAYNARGYSYLRTREYNRAIEDFTKAIELKPDYANAFQNRGVARRLAGDVAGANADARRFLELGARAGSGSANRSAENNTR